MKVTETIRPLPPKPPPRYFHIECNEEELRLITADVGVGNATDQRMAIYRALDNALAD